ncbi:GNAT family N-acetyltransferase [Taklimakanibacter lacteus]|uniref:GNAT family N-acetyltransferase n=1 Tax=Taklimakanibacter lacteus TaxID=2268456 RepID=UPI000E665D12
MASPAQTVIRFADQADIIATAKLLAAMDAHYRPGVHLPGDDEYAGMVTRTMKTQEGTRFVLCLAENMPAGLACCAILRPGRDRKGLLFVKDLFVRGEWRGRGLGHAMMRFLAAFTLEQGIGRIDLATDISNDGAQRLYDEIGGIRRPAVYFTFPDNVLRKLAEG